MTTDGEGSAAGGLGDRPAPEWFGDGGEQPPRPPGPVYGDADGIPVPPQVLADHGARWLDPTTCVTLPGQVVRPTGYVSDRLLVPLSLLTDAADSARLREEARALGLTLEADRAATELALRLRRLTDGALDLPVPIRLFPADRAVATSVDAWLLLQAWRARQPARPNRIGLDHVVPAVRPPHEGSITEGQGGAPAATGSGYILNGRTRMPVAVALADLPRLPDTCDGEPGGEPQRRPVVALADSGCGRHPWLDGIVDTDVRLDGRPIGYTGQDSDPEHSGDIVGPLDGALDWVAGHGTFIAGVVRQACPDANLLSIRVVYPDGVILEDELVDALGRLLVLAELAAAGDPEGRAIDVVSLSIGYYHELPGDSADDQPLRRVTDGFGRLGIPVVASAGNDSTIRPLYPAAFAADPVRPGILPVTSVGALNPDGTTKALFSNSGSWVRTWDSGALLVSTLPVTMDAGAQPDARLDDPAGGERAGVDPDRYSGGFGIWSGTSFAAPLVAGRIAARLLAGAGRHGAGLDDRSRRAGLERGGAALAATLAELDRSG